MSKRALFALAFVATAAAAGVLGAGLEKMTGLWWLRYAGLVLVVPVLVFMVRKRDRAMRQPAPRGWRLVLTLVFLALVVVRGVLGLAGVTSWGSLGDAAFLLCFLALAAVQLKAGSPRR
ncbi:hypothetical protein [Actinokineospora sp. NBRC 105648]|uniref:hypothetical protein n=1 Tax=Actinokineospora sp. NBRC 105648 TaxID=3032206 RepID=UPI0024A45F4C|nr:hypothetical protein [Actinokineospora sp. NBRC 105648]GLZ42483.1 hypothetical protein Acsp05_61070 [Actinokineospora sp. NBRC 105648]